MVDASLQSCVFPSGKIFKSNIILLFGMTRAAVGKEGIICRLLLIASHLPLQPKPLYDSVRTNH